MFVFMNIYIGIEIIMPLMEYLRFIIVNMYLESLYWNIE